MHQPREGFPGVGLGCLVEIIKGVFGLATSPRLWWCKMAKQILQMEIVDEYGVTVHFTQHRLDPCLFLLRDSKKDLKKSLAHM